MTELFKKFVSDVNETLGNGKNVTHFVDEDYNIVTEYNEKTLLISSGNLNEYYQVYVLGRKTYTQTVNRTTSMITKTILQFFNLKEF